MHPPRVLVVQVNTACRTALQRSKGHCCPNLSCGVEQLSTYLAWQAQHSTLVQECSVQVVAVTSSKDGQLAAAVQQLRKLKSLSFVGGRLFPDPFMAGLSSMTGLTALSVNRLSAEAIHVLPASLTELGCTIEVDTEQRQRHTVDLARLTGLRALDVAVYGKYHYEYNFNSMGPPAWSLLGKSALLQVPHQTLTRLSEQCLVLLVPC